MKEAERCVKIHRGREKRCGVTVQTVQYYDARGILIPGELSEGGRRLWTAFENLVIGSSSIPSLIITVALMTALPVLFFIHWRRKHRERTTIRWLIAGAVGFLVSSRVLELGVHYFCILSDHPVSRFINGNTAAFVLYGITMAGVFEECCRHLLLKYGMKKNRTRENAVLYGIGPGGIEILAVILPTMIPFLAVAVLFSSGERESALKALHITEETAAAALPAVQAAASFYDALVAINVMERVLAMILQIEPTVIVYYGVVNGKKICLPPAILLHMPADTFPALYQRGAVPLWAVEAWAAFWICAVVPVSVKLYRKTEKPSSPEGVL